MSSSSMIYVVAAAAGAVSLGAWIAWILLPAVTAYARIWERLVAAFLSVYVLAAFLVAGAGIGAAILWYYDEI